ncbi:MAG: hypothetical protein IJU72_08110, partial [Bacteroidales bacterium]|nr:hypothetical protein [Bacteroidales bacterium]
MDSNPQAALSIAWPHPERVLAPPPVVYRPCGAACRGGRLRVAPEGRKNIAVGFNPRAKEYSRGHHPTVCASGARAAAADCAT